MKRMAVALVVAVPVVALAADQWLHHKFNQNVLISIGNVKCPIVDLSKQYPHAVVATRIDKQQLFGCYTHKGDMIIIQWAGGDQTHIPANAFLTGDGVE